MKLITEVFRIPYKKNFILYAPLRKFVCLVNKDTIKLLDNIEEIKNPNVPTKKIINFLKDNRIIGTKSDLTFKKTPFKFAPTSVILFPTSDCNLKCKYCYANGGENPKRMNFGVAKEAIDLIIKNALKTNEKKVGLGFHGNGEPTVNIQLIKKAVLYAKKLCKKYNLKLIITIATNGIMNKEVRDWIIKNIDKIQISLDGYKKIQDLQRPFPDGSGSFNNIMETINDFDKNKVKYSFRPTITELSVTKLPKIIKFIAKNTKCKIVHIECAFCSGRCEKDNIKTPSQEKFIKYYIKSLKIASKYGVEITGTSNRIGDIKSTFCGALGKNFFVTAEGLITTCLEVSTIKDPLSSHFIYGKYNNGKFRFDFDKLKNLNKRTTNNLKKCETCFVKWHCAGDCPAKIIRNGEDMFDFNEGFRCNVNKKLSKNYLIQCLNKGIVDRKNVEVC